MSQTPTLLFEPRVDPFPQVIPVEKGLPAHFLMLHSAVGKSLLERPTLIWAVREEPTFAKETA